jgi:hypothetical protein
VCGWKFDSFPAHQPSLTLANNRVSCGWQAKALNRAIFVFLGLSETEAPQS